MDDALLLSRLQFAFVIAFHFLLPALTIGLASYIAVLEGAYLATRDARFITISKFWIRIFALAFGMGVVSGVVLPFQLGTNWSRYADSTAGVLGPLMAYESLTAFFLESAFLGVLLFGRGRVPSWAHFASAVLVAMGTLISAFWILAANSWMHTPAGFAFEDGRFRALDWFAIVFNPSLPFRFLHTVTAVYLTTAFTVMGVAAYYLLRGRHAAESALMLRMGLSLATILVPAQALIGDAHGLNTLAHQPQKIAAIESIWETGPRQAAHVFAWPDEEAERNRFALSIPLLASVILTHDSEGIVVGLTDFPKRDRPPVAPVFFGFRLMIAMWGVMLLLTGWGMWLWSRGKLSDARIFLHALWMAIPVGYVAVTAGWVTTEIGRQPFVVYGLLRTADAVNPALRGDDVIASLTLYIVVYAIVFGAGVFYIVRLVGRGMPMLSDDTPASARPARPMSASSP